MQIEILPSLYLNVNESFCGKEKGRGCFGAVLKALKGTYGQLASTIKSEIQRLAKGEVRVLYPLLIVTVMLQITGFNSPRSLIWQIIIRILVLLPAFLLFQNDWFFHFLFRLFGLL